MDKYPTSILAGSAVDKCLAELAKHNILGMATVADIDCYVEPMGQGALLWVKNCRQYAHMTTTNPPEFRLRKHIRDASEERIRWHLRRVFDKVFHIRETGLYGEREALYQAVKDIEFTADQLFWLERSGHDKSYDEMTKEDIDWIRDNMVPKKNKEGGV